ncbi:MAG: VWA domain-containing protein [Vicinamibacteria bacterium]|nr:VWA domain-containing protein [Vicinamibacteria bacterium]
MTRLLMVLSIAVGGTVAQQPVFRARTELVRIDALVTDDGAPVTGLTASDFEVRDNGARQRVTAVGAVEAVQLGVVLDVSGSMTGERLEIARAATSDLLDQLTRGDRFAIVAFADQIARVAAPGASVADAQTALELIRAGGGTALVDGLYAGILQSDQGPGPKLLVLMTDGRNNSSWLPGTSVIDSARRHETVIYPVFVGADRGGTTGVTPLRRRDNDNLALLQVIAEQTGGRQIDAQWNSTLGTVFQQILREYRQRYILTFTPEGVQTGDGWHTLQVKVKRRGAMVRARTRYWAGRP